jgi:hypothetical protein
VIPIINKIFEFEFYRRMADSYDAAIIPLGKDMQLRDRFNFFYFILPGGIFSMFHRSSLDVKVRFFVNVLLRFVQGTMFSFIKVKRKCYVPVPYTLLLQSFL